MVFNPEWGHDLDTWMNAINKKGEYINNREWTEIVLRESWATYQALDSWGVDFTPESVKSVDPAKALKIYPLTTAMVAPWLSRISASLSLLIFCSGVYPFLAIYYPLLRDYNWYLSLGAGQ
jgi:hypothetical protein